MARNLLRNGRGTLQGRTLRQVYETGFEATDEDFVRA